MTLWFSGFDSAWGGRSFGAMCDLRGRDGSGDLEIISAPEPVSWSDACARVSRYVGHDHHVIAIDQPLVVVNATGMRPVERTLARALMSTYHLGAHAANTGNACFDPTAGVWDFVEGLERAGYVQSPMAAATRTGGRWFVECYPHLAFLGLFALRGVLRYKVHHDDPDSWAEAVRLVRTLVDREPGIRNVRDVIPETFAATKANEDALDALMAAYTAAYLWHHGVAHNLIVGNLQTGYMVTPVDQTLRNALTEAFEPSDINPTGVAYSARPAAATQPAISPTHERESAKEGTCQRAVLQCTDPGNLWANANPWMTRWTDADLVVRFREANGEPVLRFVPFATNAGLSQRGMKISGDPFDRSRWLDLALGATKQHPRAYQVEYQYLAHQARADVPPLQTSGRKSTTSKGRRTGA